MAEWKQRLATCRRNLGSRTGDFWRENRRELALGYESPLDPDDALNRLWRDQELLFTRGDVQLAALVCADEHLGRRAWVGATAVVVHGPDPAFEADPDELLEIAAALDNLRHGPTPADPALARLRARLVDETDRTTWEPVPAAIAGHVPCYVSAIFLDRGAMPDGWLADSLFPILAAEGRTSAIALLPSRYWPAELASAWRLREPAAACHERQVVEVPGHGWPVPAFLVGAVALVKIPLDLATGDTAAWRTHAWYPSVSFALAGAAILLFDRHERRARPTRYFAAACAHPVEVRYDRRFLFLRPRAWVGVAFAFAAFGALGAALR